VTFTPDAPLASGQYTVNVSGAQGGDGTQQIPTSFSFTVADEEDSVSVTFRVTVPENTPVGETIYIFGNQDVWGPWNPGLAAMTNVAPNVWEATFTFPEGTQLEYKYTRGSSETVEKAADFSELDNRTLTVSGDENDQQLVEDTVANWRDPYVVSYSPADGATVTNPNTAITVTFSRPVDPATTFSVTDSTATTVPGSFAYDDATRTVTFTPDAPLASGQYTVNVSGAQGGDGTQQIPTSFSFTVSVEMTPLPSAFNLISPAQDAYFTDPSDITTVTWSASDPEALYTFVLFHFSNNVRLGEVLRLENLTPAADSDALVCTAALCTLSIAPETAAGLANGQYSWTAYAVNAGGSTEAANAPHLFSINTASRQLLTNPGFEENPDGRVATPDGWTQLGAQGDRVRCNQADAHTGSCYYNFRASPNENSRLNQNADIRGLKAGDTLTLSAFVHGRANARVRLRVIVRYTESSLPPTRLVIQVNGNTGGYQEFTDNVTLAGTPQRIRVQVQNRTRTGRVQVDDVTLTYNGLDAGGSTQPIPELPIPAPLPLPIED
jgi:methionine-rich copper-binding protein CopC